MRMGRPIALPTHTDSASLPAHLGRHHPRQGAHRRYLCIVIYEAREHKDQQNSKCNALLPAGRLLSLQERQGGAAGGRACYDAVHGAWGRVRARTCCATASLVRDTASSSSALLARASAAAASARSCDTCSHRQWATGLRHGAQPHAATVVQLEPLPSADARLACRTRQLLAHPYTYGIPTPRWVCRQLGKAAA